MHITIIHTSKGSQVANEKYSTTEPSQVRVEDKTRFDVL